MSEMTQEQIEEMTKNLKAQTQKAQAKKEEKYEREHPEAKQEQKEQESAQKDEEIRKLKQQLQETKKKALETQSKQEEEQKQHEANAAQQAVNSILSGHDSYFEKDYTVEVEGSDDFKFHIKMHSPNALEVGKIANEVVKMAEKDTGQKDVDVNHLPVLSQQIYQAIAYFIVVGDEVPEEFKHPEQIYRFEVLLDVMDDYEEWDTTFRNKRRI